MNGTKHVFLKLYGIIKATGVRCVFKQMYKASKQAYDKKKLTKKLFHSFCYFYCNSYFKIKRPIPCLKVVGSDKAGGLNFEFSKIYGSPTFVAPDSYNVD